MTRQVRKSIERNQINSEINRALASLPPVLTNPTLRKRQNSKIKGNVSLPSLKAKKEYEPFKRDGRTKVNVTGKSYDNLDQAIHSLNQNIICKDQIEKFVKNDQITLAQRKKEEQKDIYKKFTMMPQIRRLEIISDDDGERKPNPKRIPKSKSKQMLKQIKQMESQKKDLHVSTTSMEDLIKDLPQNACFWSQKEI